MLHLNKLTKQYATGDMALKGVELEIPKGQVVALIGPSGAGKSTLIRCINRLVEPTSGSVTLNDKELTKLGSGALRQARRRMGMIFQEYALVERLSVMENVLSGRLGYVGFWRSFLRKYPQSDVDEAFRLLERVGLDHMADKRADELSGGQRQRVGIARALIQDPELLLVDEPTASLDPYHQLQVMNIMRSRAEAGVGVLIVMHDLNLAMQMCNKLVLIDDGKLLAEGENSQVLTDNHLKTAFNIEVTRWERDGVPFISPIKVAG